MSRTQRVPISTANAAALAVAVMLPPMARKENAKDNQ